MARLRQTLGGRSGGPLIHSSYTIRGDTIGAPRSVGESLRGSTSWSIIKKDGRIRRTNHTALPASPMENTSSDSNADPATVAVAVARDNRQCQRLWEVQFQAIGEALQAQAQHQQRIEAMLAHKLLTPADLAGLSPHLSRNFLPNDDSITQKSLIATWRLRAPRLLSHRDLTESGFRVFSQNHEDGLLLRLFTHIGETNRCVVEIGSNCSGSDIGIPENLSTNLIINHGWHGAIVEMDQTECDRMRYFFARDHSTRHFHWVQSEVNTYFSPLIIQRAVSSANINEVLIGANIEPEPDLMIIDIDGGDYSVIQSLTAVKPRVLVVEFEKRFRERYSVFQPRGVDFGQRWQQSGATSLSAWEKLLGSRGLTLCAVDSCGFNAFFVRSDVAANKLLPLSAADAFNHHPIFSKLPEDFWLVPDETWQEVRQQGLTNDSGRGIRQLSLSFFKIARRLLARAR